MRKGILDTAETIAGYLPGAIKGIRGVLGNFRHTAHREAAFATPASFAMIQNNVTSMGLAGPVQHPSLGLSGMRYRFSQPLATFFPSWVAPNPAGFWRTTDGPATIGPDAFSILLAPYIFQGPLAFEAANHEKFVFRTLRIKLITYQTTTQKGVGVICIENDPATPVSSDFQSGRMVTPSVTFPYRIPEAVLEYFYDGPDLFFTTAPTGGDIAQSRQNHQGIIRGFDANGGNGNTEVMMYAEVSGEIEFYNPVPPLGITAQNLRERLAVETVLKALRPRTVPLQIPGYSERDEEWKKLLESAAAGCPSDLIPSAAVPDDDSYVLARSPDVYVTPVDQRVNCRPQNIRSASPASSTPASRLG